MIFVNLPTSGNFDFVFFAPGFQFIDSLSRSLWLRSLWFIWSFLSCFISSSGYDYYLIWFLCVALRETVLVKSSWQGGARTRDVPHDTYSKPTLLPSESRAHLSDRVLSDRVLSGDT